MIERIVENWLDNSIETSFQKAFCYILVNKGFKVIHLTKHNAMEMGKDILAIDNEGVPCAYQLKTARNGYISLKEWNDDLQTQMLALVTRSIDHPSIDKNQHHKSYFVCNGNLDEKVSAAIRQMNEAWERDGLVNYKLETIVKGEILKDAILLGDQLWPSELKDIKAMLDIYYENPQDLLPKDTLSSLFEKILPLDIKSKKPSMPESGRLLSALALICTIATSNYSKHNNHIAEIEAWTIYVSYLLCFVTRWEISEKNWTQEFSLALEIIYGSLDNLYREVLERNDTNFLEGDFITDKAFSIHTLRIVYLLGYLSILSFWKMNGIGFDSVDRNINGKSDDKFNEFIRMFFMKYRHQFRVWGESAMPFIFSFYWRYRLLDSSDYSDGLLCLMIKFICDSNIVSTKTPLMSPYYDVSQVLSNYYITGIDKLDDSFDGASFSIEAFIHLLSKRLCKDGVRQSWPHVSKLLFRSFEPRGECEFYRWKSEKGENITIIPEMQKDWSDLLNIAMESEGKNVPSLLRPYPILFLLLLCVFPHRLNASNIRWLDEHMIRMR